jgi:site-specific DNA-adenine methylase
MTYFLGGKKRIGKEIADNIYNISNVIENESGFIIKGYCEPFCGMMGVYNHIPDLFKNHKPKLKYKGGDRNPYIIKLWKGLQKGFQPPIKCSKKEYYELKENNDNSLKGIFLGFAASIRGIFRSTYLERNIESQANECKRIAKKIKDVHLYTGEYTIFSDLKNYIIYCDPPYKGSISPYSIGEIYNTKFEYDKFIKWCEKMSENNIVFVSEYTKPSSDFKLVWSKGKEKLYVL